jgi:hypothetical protein
MASRPTAARRGWIGDAWAQASSGVRRASVAMWVTALSLSALGVFGDLHHWWTDLQFVTNLVSSLAGALFGLPVALIVLKWLNAVEAEQRRRQDVVHLARIAVDDVVDNVDALTPDADRLAELDTVVSRLTHETFVGLSRREFSPALAAALTDWRDMRRLISATFVDTARGTAALHRADTEWRALRDQIGPLLRQYSLGWTSTPEAEVLNRIRAVSIEPLALTDDPREAVDMAVRRQSLQPIEDYYDDDVELGLTEMERHVDDVRAVVRDVIELRTAALTLQAVIQAEHLAGGGRG